MVSTSKVKIYKNYEIPKEVGKYHRLLFLSGEQKGNSYVLEGERIIIGRGSDTDIPLNENLASREHAEFKKISSQYYLTDLGSQNGTIVNDLKISQQVLKDGDRIIIGKTVFKYIIMEISEENNKELILNPSAQDLTLNLKSDATKPEIKKGAKKIQSKGSSAKIEEPKPKINKRILIYGAVLLLLGVLFLTDDKKVEKRKNPTGQTRDLIDDKVQSLLEKKNIEEDREVEKKLNSIFQSGLREEREGNYYRAINEFNMALLISPGNPRAEFYLSKAKERLKKQVEDSMKRAAQLKDALRYRGASSEYCSVIRLLQFEKENDNYKSAEEGIKEIEKILGLDEGAIKCL